MILCCGLSPAWQQVLVFDRLEPGAVNRAREAFWCASGKVLNVARAAEQLGASAVAIFPAGGLSGAAMRRDLAKSNLAERGIETAAPTRVCTTLIDGRTGEVTELVENAGPITAAELAAVQRAFRIEVGAARAVVLSGSLPAGTPNEFYRELLALVPAGVPTVVDARGPELWAALSAAPTVVKPNRAELAQTLGRPLATDAELQLGLAELRARGAQQVVVTQGAQAVWRAGADGTRQLLPPKVHVVNPIGSGDCLAAGLAVALAAGRPIEDALRLGMAAAADNARHLHPAQITTAGVEELFTRIATSNPADDSSASRGP